MVAISGSIVNGKYEMAILLPKEEKEALGLVKLTMFVALAASLILLIIILFTKAYIARILNAPEIENWLLLVPLSSLLIGFYNSLNLYNTRRRKYLEIAKSSVYKSTGLVSTQLILGFLKFGPAGLILGQIISYLAGNFILLRIFKGKWDKFKEVTTLQLSDSAKRYRKFPKFTLPAVLLNSATLNSTNLFITGISDSATLGFYSLSSRVLGSPSLIVGQSISKVYFEQSSKLKAEGGELLPTFFKTLKRLIYISAPVFTVLFFVVKPLFGFIFGQDWLIAGQYAQILLPLFFVRFISSSLSNTLDILEKQEYSLIINFILIFNMLIVFGVSFYLGFSIIKLLTIYSIASSLVYLLFIYIYYKLLCSFG